MSPLDNAPAVITRNRRPNDIRLDLRLIADMIDPGSRVLDIGCGDGTLLDYLVYEKQVDGRGIELSMDGVHACVSHGLSVIQGDADTDLKDYPSGAFDYVVLSQTLQAMRAPAQGAGGAGADRAARRSSRSRTSATGVSARHCCCWAACR